MVSQSQSKELRQLDLLPKRQPHVEPVSPELIARIRRRPTLFSAFQMSVKTSELEDKEVYGELEIDAGAFSRMMATPETCPIKRQKKKPAWFPQDERANLLLDLVQNEVPLIWWAESRGYDWTTIRKHCSDTERELYAVKQENADLRRLLALKHSVIEGRK